MSDVASIITGQMAADHFVSYVIRYTRQQSGLVVMEQQLVALLSMLASSIGQLTLNDILNS